MNLNPCDDGFEDDYTENFEYNMIERERNNLRKKHFNVSKA